MGRKRKVSNSNILGYHENCIAIRKKTRSSDMSLVNEIIRCQFGQTQVIKDGKETLNHFYASGETPDATLIIHITGPKKDVVNIMFKHAIESVGFKFKENKNGKKKNK